MVPVPAPCVLWRRTSSLTTFAFFESIDRHDEKIVVFTVGNDWKVFSAQIDTSAGTVLL